jgi:ribosomal protein L24
MAQKIKKGDRVQILSGRDKGRQGRWQRRRERAPKLVVR